MDPIKADLPRLLSSVELFVGVPQEAIEQFSKIGTNRTFFRGETILDENEVGDEMYLVISGRISISLMNKESNENIAVSTLKDGDLIGELIMLDYRRRTATALAKDDVHLVAWNQSSIVEYFDKNPVVAHTIFKNLSKILARKLTATNMILRNTYNQI